MKISLKWLNNYVKVDDYFEKPEALSELLTAAGLEVEETLNRAHDFQNVVIGKIEVLDSHPDADRLTLCQVDTGEQSLRQIVCGAKNHKQGDKVVVALPGAVLPGDFVIKKSKIRGVESLGMLCSEVELGLAEESPGIMILSEEAKVGAAFAEAWGLDDVIFDINVTANRADCLSHLGLAREIATLLGRQCQPPKAEILALKGSTSNSVKLNVNVEDCPRYAGRRISGVKVGPSPAWLKQSIEALGVNSINNIVDVTNYVMFETGQPLHAFDFQQLEGGKITVDQSKPGEKFQTFDGTEYELTGEEMMIRDGSRPVAMAGVIGGLNSGVSDKTTELFIESAHFSPQSVRRTARSFGIETDSGYRFSRGTDPEAVILAMNRACQLIQELAGGEVAEDYLDHYPRPIVHPNIAISEAYVQERLGYEVDRKSLKSWLGRLNCELQEESAEQIVVRPPAYRWDLFLKEDLVEEYARLNGYDHIPETLPALVDHPADNDADYSIERRLSELMDREGYHQAYNYAFISSEWSDNFLGDRKKLENFGLKLFSDVALQNPLSEDLNVMRVSLLPGLFQNLLHNYRHGQEVGRLFEFGHGFFQSKDKYGQSPLLSLMAWGQKSNLWQKNTDRPAVFDVKASIENLLQRLAIQSYEWRFVEPTPDFAHPRQCVGLFVEGRMIGLVASIHPAIAEDHKLRHSVAMAEIDVNQLMRGQPRINKTKPISKFPAVERDLAFLMPVDLTVSSIIKEIRKLGGQLLQSVEVFDEYRGEHLPEGKRSVAFKMVYQDLKETLSEKQLQEIQNKLIEGVTKKFQVTVR